MALSNPTTDSVGQKCACMKVSGDLTSSQIHFAVRTTAPYTSGDGSIIRSGSGSVFSTSRPNVARQYVLVTGLDDGVTHYWGAVLDTGNAVIAQFVTDAVPADADDGGIPLGGVFQ